VESSQVDLSDENQKNSWTHRLILIQST
jgi:hypothetical protein